MPVGVSLNLYSLEIESQRGLYDIIFQKIENVNEDKNYYLVDDYFKNRTQFPIERSFFIEAIEGNKTLSSAESIIIGLSEMGMKKSDVLVVVGGGCIQDLGTLVSSLYMRGINWIYVPTTLAAMGDSCIGGKSSINAGTIKNLIGNFYPPSQVLIDISFINSLPPVEIVAGISEIIKICYARSQANFESAATILQDPNFFTNSEKSQDLVYLSLKSKKYFVEIDEFDIGVRKLLNFGHSFGHAIESASNYLIPHGVAVMVGMVAAIDHSKSSKSPESEMLKSVCIQFLQGISRDVEKPLRQLNLGAFASAIKRDKKNTTESLALILPSVDRLSLNYSRFDDEAIENAVKAMKAAQGEILNEIC